MQFPSHTKHFTMTIISLRELYTKIWINSITKKCSLEIYEIIYEKLIRVVHFSDWFLNPMKLKKWNLLKTIPKQLIESILYFSQYLNGNVTRFSLDLYVVICQSVLNILNYYMVFLILRLNVMNLKLTFESLFYNFSLKGA